MSALDPREELRQLLATLDVPDCDCPLDLACPCGEACRPGPSPACHACVLGPGVSGPLVHPTAPAPCAEHCEHCSGRCDCRPALFQPPCRHVLRAAHTMPIEKWLRFMRLAYPEPQGPPPAPGSIEHRRWQRAKDWGYGEPDRAAVPTLMLRRAARVATFALRRERGLALRHEQDLCADQVHPRVLRRVRHLANGSDEVLDWVVAYRPPEEFDPWEDARVEALADRYACHRGDVRPPGPPRNQGAA